MSGIDILSLGEPLIEFNRQSDGKWLQGFGGDVSNCAIAAARQGARAGMLAHLGQDRFGDGLMGLWGGEGLDTSRIVRRADSQTGIYFVDHDGTGHHFTYYRRDSAASRMTPEDIGPELFEDVKILHVSGISQAISESARAAVAKAIAVARETGTRISYDTNLRLSLWSLDDARAVINDTAPKADILLPGYDDARQLTGLEDPEAIVRHYLDQDIGLVALTLGESGALIGTRERLQRIEPHIVESVDATGAGDTFDGAMLARLIAGDDPFTAAVYANAAAALSTTGYSAVAPIPRTDDVRAFLAANA